jgi:hypothetical protein
MARFPWKVSAEVQFLSREFTRYIVKNNCNDGLIQQVCGSMVNINLHVYLRKYLDVRHSKLVLIVIHMSLPQHLAMSKE